MKGQAITTILNMTLNRR